MTQCVTVPRPPNITGLRKGAGLRPAHRPGRLRGFPPPPPPLLFSEEPPRNLLLPSGSEAAALLRPHAQEPSWRRRPSAPAPRVIAPATRWWVGRFSGGGARGRGQALGGGRDHVPTVAGPGRRSQVAAEGGLCSWLCPPGAESRRWQVGRAGERARGREGERASGLVGGQGRRCS